jgi:hypothetical protein
MRYHQPQEHLRHFTAQLRQSIQNNQDCQTPSLSRQPILQTAGLSQNLASQKSEDQISGIKKGLHLPWHSSWCVGSHAVANQQLLLALLLHCEPPQQTLLSVSLMSHHSILDAMIATKVLTIMCLNYALLFMLLFTSIFVPVMSLFLSLWSCLFVPF